MTKSICWICEGWKEVTFTWYPYVSGPFKVDILNDPIFIHFEHEKFLPIIMEEIKYKEGEKAKVAPKKLKNKWGKLKAKIDAPPAIT